MYTFNYLQANYSLIYPYIGLRVHGILRGIGIFKEYWYGRRVDRQYVWPQKRTGKAQGNRIRFYDASKEWSLFDEETKRYYNRLKYPVRQSGIARYIRLYCKVNPPMIIYWSPLEKSAADSQTIEEALTAQKYFTKTGTILAPTTAGDSIVAEDHGTATTAQVINATYGTSATPPAANTTPIGSLYIQYVT